MEPLSLSLNCAVNSIANRLFPLGFDVQGVDTAKVAPSTYEELCAQFATGRHVVASEGSENTIYACKETNYAFRAWHDWCHVRGGHDFSLEGEKAVCAMQIEHLRKFYPGNPDLPKWERILEAEIVGQALYFAKHGKFPKHQRAFVEAYIRRNTAALLRAAEIAY